MILEPAAPLAPGALGAWATSLALLAAGLVAGLLARRWLFRRLQLLARHTARDWDDRLIAATRGLWLPGIALLALAPAARAAPVAPELAAALGRAAVSGFLLVLVIFVARFAGSWLAGAPAAGAGEGRPALLRQGLRAAILVAGGLFVADNLGLEIGTLITALGVGSLAIGLALQPTLSNFFAGLYISTAKPIRVGDFVELEDGTQGFVADIGWRATRLRQLANNVVEIPNSRLAEMRLVNYSLPDPAQSVLVEAGVAYGSDLDQVERVVLAVAGAVQREVEGADPAHRPLLRFHTFASSSIDFSVVLRARSFTDRWPLIHEFTKRLRRSFAEAGVEIPFPQLVVHSERGA